MFWMFWWILLFIAILINIPPIQEFLVTVLCTLTDPFVWDGSTSLREAWTTYRDIQREQKKVK